MMMRQLIAACKKASFYPGLRWEVGLDNDKTNPNYPFKPGARPGCDDFNDAWGGDMCPLSEVTKDIKPGHWLDCYIYERDGGSLHTNVEIRVISETKAIVDGKEIDLSNLPQRSKRKPIPRHREEKKNGVLWVKNTSRYSMAEVWPLMKTAYESVKRSLLKDQRMPRIFVRFQNKDYGAWGGHAECYSPKRDDKGNIWYHVLVKVGAPECFPCKCTDSRFRVDDMPQFDIADYREAALMVGAHEMEHCCGASGRKNGELTCGLSGWDAIDYYKAHKDEVLAEINHRLTKVEERKERHAAKKTPSARLARRFLEASKMLSRWRRRATSANNKLKKYQRLVKVLKKQMENQTTMVIETIQD